MLLKSNCGAPLLGLAKYIYIYYIVQMSKENKLVNIYRLKYVTSSMKLLSRQLPVTQRRTLE